MRQKTQPFQSTRFLIWILVLLNLLMIVMPSNAVPVEHVPFVPPVERF